MKPTDASADAPAMVILDSPAVVSWRATFEPIKKDLTSAHDWFVFGHADDPRDPGHALARQERALGNHPEVQALLPDHFVRDLVVRQAHRDLLVGGVYRSAVSMDPLHGRILTAQIRSGTAAPAFGPQALTILVPDVRSLSWADILELRAIEDCVSTERCCVRSRLWRGDASESLDEFEDVVHREFVKRLTDAVDAKSLPRRLVRAAVSRAVGEMAGLVLTQVPMAGGAVGLAVSAVEEARGWSARRWVGAHHGITRRSRPGHDL
jgi:hypothetical protein